MTYFLYISKNKKILARVIGPLIDQLIGCPNRLCQIDVEALHIKVVCLIEQLLSFS